MHTLPFSAWHDYVDQGLEKWLDFHKFWLNTDIPIHIIHYDHLVADISHEINSVSKFLDFNSNETTVRCVMNKSEGQFHRQRRKLPIDLYTGSERKKAAAYVLEINSIIYQIKRK